MARINYPNGGLSHQYRQCHAPYFYIGADGAIMGTFDEWQAQKNEQYILVLGYINEMCKRPNCHVEAIIDFLLTNYIEDFEKIRVFRKHDNTSNYELLTEASTENTKNTKQAISAAKVLSEIKKALSKDALASSGIGFMDKELKPFKNLYFEKSIYLPPFPNSQSNVVNNTQPLKTLNILERDPYLTHLDIFDVVEASCLMSGDDPIEISVCRGDTNFWQNYNDYLKAENLINAGIKSGKLDSEITSKSLQYFLKEKDVIVRGFNDKLPNKSADTIGQPTITQTVTPTNPELSQQLTDLQAQLASLQADNDRLTLENQQQANTILELNERLEGQASQSEPIEDNPSYTTTAITALNHVITEFWNDWQQGTPPPKQAHIEAWIMENYPAINKTTATNIDRIARHETAK